MPEFNPAQATKPRPARTIAWLITVAIAISWFCLGRAQAQNPGVVEVGDPSPFSKIVAISDVHGEYAHVQTLLHNAGIIDTHDHWTAGKTLMVVVGDSIDKGPKSVEVLRLWMSLQTEAKAHHGLLIVLLGNHEAEFLADPSDDKSAKTRDDAKENHLTTADLTDPGRPLGAFLRGLPIAARIGKWVFCHAGWIPDQPWPAFAEQVRSTLNAGHYGAELILGDDSILVKKSGPAGKKWWQSPHEVRELERRLDADGFAGVVFGHRPLGLDIRNNVGESKDGRIFKIDSGMAPLDKEDKGGDPHQPYDGHVLVFPHPSELQKPFVAGTRVTASSVSAKGKSNPIPPLPHAFPGR